MTRGITVEGETMKDEMRYIVGGAAIGAMAGAVAAWVYYRRSAPQRAPEIAAGAAGVPLDRGRLMRLAWAVIGVVRQVLELG
jgi:hypothetical protein